MVSFMTPRCYVFLSFCLLHHHVDYHWDRHLYFVIHIPHHARLIDSYLLTPMTHTPPSDDSILVLLLVVLVACDSD
jgi:hypothetical protein